MDCGDSRDIVSSPLARGNVTIESEEKDAGADLDD